LGAPGFSTKNRTPFLHTKEIRTIVIKHIHENAKEKNIWLDCVNGHEEHAHCLISLGREQSIGKITQLIKGESSFWINDNNLLDRKFSWQDDYWAVGVSESHLKKVRRYIHSQEEHHQSVSFKKEIDDFMRKHNWEKIKS